MAFIGNNPKQNTSTNNPLSADPTNPTEGMLHHSDGSARTEGLWVYQNAAWVKIVSGSTTTLTTDSKSASFTALLTDDLYFCDSTSGLLTVTLPTASGNTGKQFIIVKSDSSSNLVTLDGDGSETINGATTVSIGAQYQTISIISDGTNWTITANDPSKLILGDGDSGLFETSDDVVEIRTGGTAAITVDANSDVDFNNMWGTGAEENLTISTGAVTITKSYANIDTESAAASDDLDTITGGSNGNFLVIKASSSTRTVVVKDGTGNLRLAGDFNLTHVQDRMLLHFDGSFWIELTRSNNAA